MRTDVAMIDDDGHDGRFLHIVFWSKNSTTVVRFFPTDWLYNSPSVHQSCGPTCSNRQIELPKLTRVYSMQQTKRTKRNAKKEKEKKERRNCAMSRFADIGPWSLFSRRTRQCHGLWKGQKATNPLHIHFQRVLRYSRAWLHEDVIEQARCFNRRCGK